jgi:PhnB protein
VHISLMMAVEDAPSASAWYQRGLGASVLWSLGSAVGLEIERAPFFLHEPTSGGFESPASIGRTTVRVEVFADNPDAFVARAVAAGADGSADEIRDHEVPWGVHRQVARHSGMVHVHVEQSAANRNPCLALRTRAGPFLFHSVAHSRNERWEDRQLPCFTCWRW